ncbi:hypothetical protein VVR12_08920 [Rothia sp. LK2588]|uniref:hypothetical protein n=1 Tax=Rothia sp. LK2588 TaxID=3114369 RepID=UPI0034CE051C
MTSKPSREASSLKLYIGLAVALAVLTVFLLPIPFGVRLFLLVVLAVSAVFVFVDATGKGKTFSAIVVAALVFYLGLCIQRGVFLLADPTPASVVLGVGMIVLPLVGAWAMVREIIFGARVQAMAAEMDAAGELPEDNLPRSASGRVDRAAADAEFRRFTSFVEEEPLNWKYWFNLSTLYGAAGDRKRARKSMRTAIALYRGKTDLDLSV